LAPEDPQLTRSEIEDMIDGGRVIQRIQNGIKHQETAQPMQHEIILQMCDLDRFFADLQKGNASTAI
jgi:hypothetical protein